MRPFFIAAVLVCFICEVSGQQKYEKESRLNEHEAPQAARQFIDSLDLEGKVRWYLEEGIERKSVEAKFRKDRLQYSVEFDTDGNLEDVEILRDWKELDESIRESIVDKLCEDCWKIKIQKIQFQYTGELSAVWFRVKSGEGSENYTLRYEIVVRCRTPSATTLYEYLYSDSGEKLSRSEIVFKNATNLEY